MFTPAIYITHKTLRQVVDLEIGNYQFKNELKHFIPKYENNFIIDFFSIFQGKFNKKILTEKEIKDFLSQNKKCVHLRSLQNALQAVNAHENSLRAEDDWNLLVRINHLIINEDLTFQTPHIRIKNKLKEEKAILKLHKFENNEQIQHFILELFRWYRTSDKDIERMLRITTILYHLIKVSPFTKYNNETILLFFSYLIRENKLELLKTFNITEFVLTVNNPEIELNEFVQEFLKYLVKSKNRLFFEIEKLNIEKTAPKKILNLNKRQIELLKIMQAKDKISRREAAEILEVSFMTAYRDIKGLLKKKLLVEQGVGRGTYYVLASK